MELRIGINIFHSPSGESVRKHIPGWRHHWSGGHSKSQGNTSIDEVTNTDDSLSTSVRGDNLDTSLESEWELFLTTKTHTNNERTPTEPDALNGNTPAAWKFFHVRVLVIGAHPQEIKTFANKTEWVGFGSWRVLVSFHYRAARSPCLTDVAQATKTTVVTDPNYHVILLLTKEVLCDVPKSYLHQTAAQSLSILEWRTVWDELNACLSPTVPQIWMLTTKVYPPLLQLFTSIAQSRGLWYSRSFEIWQASHPFCLLQLSLMCLDALTIQPGVSCELSCCQIPTPEAQAVLHDHGYHSWAL